MALPASTCMLMAARGGRTLAKTAPVRGRDVPFNASAGSLVTWELVRHDSCRMNIYDYIQFQKSNCRFFRTVILKKKLQIDFWNFREGGL